MICIPRVKHVSRLPRCVLTGETSISMEGGWVDVFDVELLAPYERVQDLGGNEMIPQIDPQSTVKECDISTTGKAEAIET